MNDHNHLRISRILRSLRILGLESEAAAFYKVLSDILHSANTQLVSCRSAEFWRRSAERPLHWSPQIPEDICHADKNWSLGLDFLREYEKLKMARDLQKQHDENQALEEKKEAEFLATKEHIAAVNAARDVHEKRVAASRKRKIGDSNISPKSKGIDFTESEERCIFESQLNENDQHSVITNASEVMSKPQPTIGEDPTIQKGRTVTVPKVTNPVGRSIVREVQHYQLLAPRQP